MDQMAEGVEHDKIDRSCVHISQIDRMSTIFNPFSLCIFNNWEVGNMIQTEAAMLAEKRAKVLTKGRLFQIQWKKKNAPSTSTEVEESPPKANPHDCSDIGKMMAQKSLPSEWTLGKNRILPMTRNFVMTNTKRHAFCYCCWGKVRKFVLGGIPGISCLHCMISYKDKSYHIRDLRSEKGTFVNGIKLEPLSSRKLVDGDFISLGRSHEDPLFKEENAPNVLFYYQAPLMTILGWEVKAFDKMPAVAISVFGNALILAEILSSLPLCDLKSVRLVNKEWNKESSKWFYAKSVQILPRFDCTRWKTLVEPYWAYYNTNVSISLKILTEPRQELEELEESTTIEADQVNQVNRCQKQFEQNILDLKSYFQNNGKNIRTLRLEMDAEHLPVLTSNLQSLRNLRELNLAVGYLTLTKENVLRFAKDSAEGFPNVEKLTIDVHQICISEDEDDIIDALKFGFFFKYVFKMLPSLSKLFLGARTISPFLWAVLKKTPMVEKLTEFSIKIKQPDDKFFLHCQTIMDLPFKTPLKRLEIGKLPAERITIGNHNADGENVQPQPPTDPAVLTRLIEKFSQSLEHLSLEIRYYYDNGTAALLTYTIPPLPKLKTLELTACIDREDSVAEGAGELAEHFWFNFQNPDGVGGVKNTVDYGLMFPKLKTLILKYPHDFERIGTLFGSKLMEPFFPRVGGVKCSSLTRLVLPNLMSRPWDPEYREWFIWLSEIFPNVHLPLFRTARAGKWKWDGFEETERKEHETRQTRSEMKSFDDDLRELDSDFDDSSSQN